MRGIVISRRKKSKCPTNTRLRLREILWRTLGLFSLSLVSAGNFLLTSTSTSFRIITNPININTLRYPISNGMESLAPHGLSEHGGGGEFVYSRVQPRLRFLDLRILIWLSRLQFIGLVPPFGFIDFLPKQCEGVHLKYHVMVHINPQGVVSDCLMSG